MIRGPARPAVQNTASSYCCKLVYACFIVQPLLFCRFSLPQRSASCLAAGSRTVQTAAAARPGIPPASPGGIGQKLNHCDGGFSLFRIVKLLPDQGSGRASCLPRFPAAARLLFNLHRMRPVGSSLLGAAFCEYFLRVLRFLLRRIVIRSRRGFHERADGPGRGGRPHFLFIRKDTGSFLHRLLPERILHKTGNHSAVRHFHHLLSVSRRKEIRRRSHRACGCPPGCSASHSSP